MVNLEGRTRYEVLEDPSRVSMYKSHTTENLPGDTEVAGLTLSRIFFFNTFVHDTSEHLSWVLKQISRKTESSQILIVTHRDRGSGSFVYIYIYIV